MQRTSIQWSEFTDNPFRARLAGSTLTKGGYASGVGHYCEKISAGCKNCYSSSMQPRFGLPEFHEQRRGGVEWFLDASKLAAALRHRKPAKIFWCDMTDMFGEWVPNEWIAACFGVMAATPQHTHQVLTKRARRMREWFEWVADDARRRCDLAAKTVTDKLPLGYANDPWPLPNVWIGVSCENQRAADERIPELLACPSAVRWVSAEPLLGPIDFRRWLEIDREAGNPRWIRSGFAPELDWIIVGGESGHRARPFDLDWGRSIVAQCKAAGTPVFVKQLGSRPRWDPDGEKWWKGPHTNADGSPRFADSHGGDMAEWPDDLRIREFPVVA